MPARLVEHWSQGRLTVVISLPLIEELADVLGRPRLKRKYKLQDRDIADLLRLLTARTILVPVTGGVAICRDPDDNVVLETAITGGAGYVVTRDDDVKRDPVVSRYMRRHRIQVMSVSRFLSILQPST